MKLLVRAALILAPMALLALPPAHAESLRCGGASAAEGDSLLSVAYKCGQPLAVDVFCAPVYLPGSLWPVPAAAVPGGVPCLRVEEWLYDRGQGNLMATVRFLDGRVQSIRYSRLPE